MSICCCSSVARATGAVLALLVLSFTAAPVLANSVIVTSLNVPRQYAADGSFISQPNPISRSSQLELVGDEIWATGIIDGSGQHRSVTAFARFDATTFQRVAPDPRLSTLSGDILFTGTEVLISGFGGASRWATDGTLIANVPFPRVAQLELVGDEIWGVGFLDGGGSRPGSILRFDAVTYQQLGVIQPPQLVADLVFTGTEVLVSSFGGRAYRYTPNGGLLGQIVNFAPVAQLELVGNEIWGTGFVNGGNPLAGSGGIARYDASTYAFLGSFGTPGPTGDLLAIPEPGTALLMGLGLTALGFRRRSRRG